MEISIEQRYKNGDDVCVPETPFRKLPNGKNERTMPAYYNNITQSPDSDEDLIKQLHNKLILQQTTDGHWKETLKERDNEIIELRWLISRVEARKAQDVLRLEKELDKMREKCAQLELSAQKQMTEKTRLESIVTKMERQNVQQDQAFNRKLKRMAADFENASKEIDIRKSKEIELINKIEILQQTIYAQNEKLCESASRISMLEQDLDDHEKMTEMITTFIKERKTKRNGR